jgi:hypothetical protein
MTHLIWYKFFLHVYRRRIIYFVCSAALFLIGTYFFSMHLNVLSLYSVSRKIKHIRVQQTVFSISNSRPQTKPAVKLRANQMILHAWYAHSLIDSMRDLLQTVEQSSVDGYQLDPLKTLRTDNTHHTMIQLILVGNYAELIQWFRQISSTLLYFQDFILERLENDKVKLTAKIKLYHV